MPGDQKTKTRTFYVRKIAPSTYLVDGVATIIVSHHGYVVCDKTGRACWPALPVIKDGPMADYFRGFGKQMMKAFQRAFEPILRAASPLLSQEGEEVEVEVPDVPAVRFAAALLTHIRKYGTLSALESLI